jgi:hypothetical protein
MCTEAIDLLISAILKNMPRYFGLLHRAQRIDRVQTAIQRG